MITQAQMEEAHACMRALRDLVFQGTQSTPARAAMDEARHDLELGLQRWAELWTDLPETPEPGARRSDALRLWHDDCLRWIPVSLSRVEDLLEEASENEVFPEIFWETWALLEGRLDELLEAFSAPYPEIDAWPSLPQDRPRITGLP